MELNLSVNASRTGFPSSNLSVCFADSSPGRATTTTAASGGNREELLGLRSAIRKQSEADAGYRNPDNGTALAVTERLSPNKTY